MWMYALKFITPKNILIMIGVAAVIMFFIMYSIVPTSELKSLNTEISDYEKIVNTKDREINNISVKLKKAEDDLETCQIESDIADYILNMGDDYEQTIIDVDAPYLPF